MKRTAVAFALVAGIGFVGCGSDSDALSRDELVNRGNAACEEFSEQLEEYFDKILAAEPNASDEVKAERIAKVAALGEQLDGNLRDLEPPKDMADAYDEAISAQAQQVADYREAADLAKSGDMEQAEKIGTRADEASKSVEKKFDDLGLSECGSAAGTSD